MKKLDARQLPTTAVGLALVLAPLFSLASSLVAPGLRSDEAAQLDVIAQQPERWYWFTLLLTIGSILLVPALIGIAALVRHGAPRLAAVGGGLAILGALIALGDAMSQFMTWQMVANGADHAQMAALLERFDNAGGVAAVFSIGGLAAVVGVLLLTVGLIRARRAPAWAASGLTVAVLVNIVGFSSASNGLVAASWALLLVAMGYIGRMVLAGESQAGPPVDFVPAQPASEAR